MMDDYDSVQKGGLKLKGLKGVSEHGSKRKKKKDKDKKKMDEIVTNAEIEGDEELTFSRPKKTKAELSYERAKRKKTEEQILERASKNHKERIMEFNQHLDNLTEHFDIPKVSWTK